MLSDDDDTEIFIMNMNPHIGLLLRNHELISHRPWKIESDNFPRPK